MPNTTDTDDLLRAGREALSQGAWEEARAAFEQALAIEETPEILEQLGLAAWWLNDATMTFHGRERAFQLYRAQGDSRSAARVACWIAVDCIEYRGEHAVANGWLQRARRLLEDVDSSPEHGLHMLLMGHLALMGNKDTAEARRIGAEALLLGRSLKAVDVEMMGLALEGLAMVSEGEISAGMRLLDEATAIAVAGEGEDLNVVGTTCCYMISACERIRDFDRAAQWCDRVREFCSRWRFGSLFAVCRTQYAFILMLQGRWKEAEEEYARAESELLEYRPAMATASRIRLGELRRRQGRFDEAEAIFDTSPSHPVSLLGRASIALDRGDAATAYDLAERYLRRVPEADRLERGAGLELIARAAIVPGNRDRAIQALEELQAIALEAGTEAHRAVAESVAGLIALDEGATESALHHLENAIELYERARMPFEAASARIDLATALAGTSRQSMARAEAELALTTLRSLGGAFAIECAERVLNGDLPSPAPVLPPSDPAGSDIADLTRRELDVLGLIGSGLSNDEIAARLFLSVRTVERHISNIYLKIGATGKAARAVAVSFAIRHGVRNS
jgi:ATP/maltotriose-dependent transcriptional regulator MalT